MEPIVAKHHRMPALAKSLMMPLCCAWGQFCAGCILRCLLQADARERYQMLQGRGKGKCFCFPRSGQASCTGQRYVRGSHNHGIVNRPWAG